MFTSLLKAIRLECVFQSYQDFRSPFTWNIDSPKTRQKFLYNNIKNTYIRYN